MSGPVFLSTALHAVLFVGLLGVLSLRGDAPPTQTFQVFSVELVQLSEGTDQDGGQSDLEQDDRSPDVAARRGAEFEQPATDAATAEAGAPASSAGVEAEDPETSENAPAASAAASLAEEDDAAQPTETQRDEPTPHPTVQARAPAPAPTAAPRPADPEIERIGLPLEAAAREPDHAAGDLESPLLSDEVVPHGASPTSPRPLDLEPQTRTMAEAQRSMLEGKLEQWAERLPRRGLPGESVEWEHDGQHYTATFTQVTAGDEMGLDEVIVAIGTEASGRKLSAELRMRRLAFSHYAQFVDQWDRNVQIHDDEIDGRFHSNSEIFVSQSRNVRPVFHGRVTTSQGVNTSHSQGRVSRNQIFRGGLETRARRIGLPKRFQPPVGEETPAEEDAHYFEEDARIEFYANGTYGWRPLDDAGAEQRGVLPDEPFYLIAGSRVTLHVRGSVRGTALVYSPHKIVIEGDLVYATDPRDGIGEGDFLGLVSDRDVEIADPDVTGPGDLTIHGSIYAKRRFLVRRYSAREDATLYVYGSVTAGSLSASEPRYRTRIEFDPRLEERRPPSFPMTDRYELADWDALWTLEPTQETRASAGEAARPGP